MKQGAELKQLVMLWVLGIVSAMKGEELGGVWELGEFAVHAGGGERWGMGGGAVVERLGGEARIDVQGRGGLRYQVDLVVRGGLFEGTGVALGGLVIVDPQTGHYIGELPFGVGSIGEVKVKLGAANGHWGINATAGTLGMEWAGLVEGGEAALEAGGDGHLGGRVRIVEAVGVGHLEVGVGAEQGDGSVEGGDYDTVRANVRWEGEVGEGRLRVFGGHMVKRYGWPGMYTGIARLLETEDYALSLVGWQYAVGDAAGDGGHWVGGYWRRLVDDYEFNRNAPGTAFEHATEVWSLQGAGDGELGEWRWGYRWSVLWDDIVRSTSLTEGAFGGRRYGKVGGQLERRLWEGGDGALSGYAGLGVDSSEHESTVGTPLAGLRYTWLRDRIEGQVYIEGARSSQVPGYTVLKSRPTGLFGGNAQLGREMADNIEIGGLLAGTDWQVRAVVFERRDEGLIDWVYAAEAVNARQAAALDSTTRGLELQMGAQRGDYGVQLGYAYLDKTAAYREAGVAGSFYALNYARHRWIAALDALWFGRWSARLEAEWREQADNPLRSGAQTALRVNLYTELRAFPVEGWSLRLRVDNLGKDDFGILPGTPGPGREWSVGLATVW